MIELDRFEIIEKIGEGSMGEVYKARQVSMDRAVALKVLYSELAQDEAFADRFMREARAIGKLNHPNIVQGIDFGQSGEHLYFVMEYVKGPSLYEILKQEALDEDEVLEVGLQVARALEHGHSQGIIHRDIKPGNIMISTEGAAKVTDYGLAKRIEGSSEKSTAHGKVLGTPYYISPEQARGEQDIDIRSDIYSLGASLYHAATGKPPFPGKNAPHIMSKALNDPFPDPREAKPELTAAFARLILKLTQKDKAKRPANPAALIKEIERVMRASAAERQRQSIGANLRRTLHRVVARDAGSEPVMPPKIKMALVGGIAAVIVVVLVAFLLPGSAQPEKPPAPPPQAGKTAVTPVKKTTEPGKVVQDKDSYADEQMRKAEAELAEKARQAYLQAEAFARGTTDIEEAVARLNRLAESYAGPYAQKARKLAGELRTGWEKEGEEELKKRKAAAAQALVSLNYGAAAKVYAEFPERLQNTVAGMEAGRLEGEITEQGRSHYGRLRDQAQKLASQGNYDEAVELYRKAAGFGLKEVTSQANARVARLQKEKALAQARLEEEKRRRTEQLYQAFYPRYAALVEKKDFKAAVALCQAELDDSSRKEIHELVRVLLSDVQMVIKVDQAGREGADNLRLQEYTFELEGGRTVEGLVKRVINGIIDVEIATMKGAVIGVEIDRLTGQCFVKLALVMLGDKPESHLACGVYLLLAKKDGIGAQKEFDLAAAGGIDTSRYKDRITAVKGRQVEQQAQRLLEELVKSIKRKKWKDVARIAQTLTRKYSDTRVVKTSRAEIEKAHTEAALKLASEEKTKPSKKTKKSAGLVGTYYNGRNFDDLKARRIDSTIDFNWREAAPHPDVRRNNFSVRWEGFVAIPKSGRYTFIVNSDDGCRMWLAGQELLNDWRNRGAEDSTKEIALKKGYYPIKIEYYDAGGHASVRLLWSVGGQRQVIPAEYLSHTSK